MMGQIPFSLDQTTTYTPVTPGNTQWNLWEITFAGSLTPQQHKLGQYVVVNVPATLLHYNWPFPGSYQTFQQVLAVYETSMSLNNALKANSFTLERIIGSPTGTTTMQFRAGLGVQNRLDHLEAAVANQSLAKLILDYMIPCDDKKNYYLALELDQNHFMQKAKQLQQIQSNTDANYQIYLDSQIVAVKDVKAQPNVTLNFYGSG